MPDGSLSRAAGQLLRDARAAVRLLHAGHADRGAGAARRESRGRRKPRSAKRSAATSAAAPATSRSWKRSSCAARRGVTNEPRAAAIRRFPLHRQEAPREGSIRASSRAAGATSPTSRCAGHEARRDRRLARTRARASGRSAPRSALAMPRRALRARPARSSARRPIRSLIGVDAPKVTRYRAGARTSCATPANGSRRWSPTRARSPRTRPSWSRSTTSRCRTSSTRRRRSSAAARSCIPAHGSNVLYHRRSSGGRSTRHFAQRRAPARVPRGVGPQLDGADRDLRRRRAVGRRAARSSISGRRSRCRSIPDQTARALRLPGQRGARALTTSTSAAATA